MATKCTHLNQIQENVTPRTPQGCEECLQMGDTWVQTKGTAGPMSASAVTSPFPTN